MQINIAKPLKVVTNTLGLPVMVPGERKYVRVYPKLLEVYDLNDSLLESNPLDLPHAQVVQDLDRGGVVVGKKRLFANPPPCCQVSFGSHKKLSWEGIVGRRCLVEILPIWHRLGRFYGASVGAFGLDIFSNYFEGVMVPRAQDRWHQGLNLPDCEDPITLLTGGAGGIEAMIVQETEGEVDLLPHLMPELHCGRMVGKEVSFGLIDFEWTKKRARRLKVQATRECEITLVGREFKSFRVCHSRRLDAGRPLLLQPDQTYMFDRFER